VPRPWCTWSACYTRPGQAHRLNRTVPWRTILCHIRGRSRGGSVGGSSRTRGCIRHPTRQRETSAREKREKEAEGAKGESRELPRRSGTCARAMRLETNAWDSSFASLSLVFAFLVRNTCEMWDLGCGMWVVARAYLGHCGEAMRGTEDELRYDHFFAVIENPATHARGGRLPMKGRLRSTGRAPYDMHLRLDIVAYKMCAVLDLKIAALCFSAVDDSRTSSSYNP
jgi:hypothetical protein